MSLIQYLNRLIMPGIMVVFLAGCESTFMSMISGDEHNKQEDDEHNLQEGSIIGNPFLNGGLSVNELSMADERQNKTELEFGALPPEPGMTDMTMMSDEELVLQEQEWQNMMKERSHQPQNFTPMIRVPRNSYQPKYTHKLLNDYAEQMAMDLMARAKNLDTQSKIGIASFVDLTRNLQTTTILGNQLSESFMNEIQAYGISVVDYKTLDEIYVGQAGDLIFDRSGPRGDMQYVLSGTLQRSSRGVQVNARIIHLKDNVVVSSAKGFIPHFVVSSLTPDYVLMH